MYIDPVLLPAFSNREDFLTTISIFDDDTGKPVNLAGVLALANPNGFTGASWTVTDGAIQTSSDTSFTIPGYPVGNQLSALALTVEAGLGIIAGDPIVISDLPGANSVAGYVTSYASSTGELVCQIGVTFQFEVRSQRPLGYGADYFPYFDYGGGAGPGIFDWPPVLSASLGNGILITDLGYIQVRIQEVTTRRMVDKTYLASMTMTDSVDTRQLFIGKLPSKYGGVTN